MLAHNNNQKKGIKRVSSLYILHHHRNNEVLISSRCASPISFVTSMQKGISAFVQVFAFVAQEIHCYAKKKIVMDAIVCHGKNSRAGKFVVFTIRDYDSYAVSEEVLWW